MTGGEIIFHREGGIDSTEGEKIIIGRRDDDENLQGQELKGQEGSRGNETMWTSKKMLPIF